MQNSKVLESICRSKKIATAKEISSLVTGLSGSEIDSTLEDIVNLRNESDYDQKTPLERLDPPYKNIDNVIYCLMMPPIELDYETLYSPNSFPIEGE